ncbi:hypothetical protein WSM22_18470 [Cytophagales bacterium WSM2-2]|nr:hypothetical protein WSM22_18470 [Cytophagales bacterium WSM2-2]
MKYLLFFVLTVGVTFEWKSLETPEFKIKYSDTWELDQSGSQNTKFILYAPRESAAFRNNINLIVQDLKGLDLDLKKYADLSTSQIKQYLTDATIHQSETTGTKHTVIFSGTQGEFKLKWKQYYWVKGEKAYVLTLTTSQASFDNQLGTANPIMDSFVLK